MMRCCSKVASVMGSGAVASGWWGATAKTKSSSPSSQACRPATLLELTATPMARSARPEVSVSSVPVRMPSRSFSRVGGCMA